MIEKPKEIIITLPTERKLSEFVNWNGKPLYDYIIKVPTWLSEDYLKHTLGFVQCKFSIAPTSLLFKEENRKDYQEFLDKKWHPRLTKMRKLNNGYMKIMTEVSPRELFETHQGYMVYHKELAELNKKYMKSYAKDEQEVRE